jgi:hypothetical protein
MVIDALGIGAPGAEYPREDKCKHCGTHIGWILHPLAEALALEVCDKQECLEKKRKESHEKEITGGDFDVGS